LNNTAEGVASNFSRNYTPTQWMHRWDCSKFGQETWSKHYKWRYQHFV